MKLNPIAVKYIHDLTYINFKSKKYIQDNKVVSKSEFYETVKDLKESGYQQIAHTTISSKYKRMCFVLSEKVNHLRLTWKDGKGKYHQRYTNFKDDSKNKRDKINVFKDFRSRFEEQYNVKLSKAFGKTEQLYKRCVPGLFHYDNPEYINGICVKTGKLDFSSHFPSCACGTLPNANESKVIDGYAEPTEEYPFAFYINSGFIAEYNKYNTRDWFNTRYGKNLFDNSTRKFPVNPKAKEITVLMKASEYHLDELMNHYYQLKLKCQKGTEEYQEAKTALLKLVGMLEMNSPTMYMSRPYAHLAAVIKSRAIYKMLKLIENVGESRVISVIVDGLIFNNSKGLHLGDKTEFLGSLKEETYQALGRFKRHNQYVITEGEEVIIAHAGYDINIDNLDMNTWGKSPAVHIKEVLNEINVQIEDLNYEKEKN